MSKKENRYVATIEMYVYAENDYMAKKRANDLKLSIENRRHSDQVKVTEIGWLCSSLEDQRSNRRFVLGGR